MEVLLILAAAWPVAWLSCRACLAIGAPLWAAKALFSVATLGACVAVVVLYLPTGSGWGKITTLALMVAAGAIPVGLWGLFDSGLIDDVKLLTKNTKGEPIASTAAQENGRATASRD